MEGMNDQRPKQSLPIGHFGRLSQLSRKALRLYDDRGILSPAWIDPGSGYRYYSHDQLTIARRVRLLRAMEMPLDQIAIILEAWENDPLEAVRLIHGHIASVEKKLETVRLAARLLMNELSPDMEQIMTFQFNEQEMDKQNVASIRRRISVPRFHAWIKPALRQLWGHIEAAGAKAAGDPVALYYGPVNENDDGPVEICVPFQGDVPPGGEIKIRELPAHKAIQIRTFGEYNDYPKLLEMWNAVGQYVHEQNLESNWDSDMTTYEIWHEDETMTIGWPVRSYKPDTQ